MSNYPRNARDAKRLENAEDLATENREILNHIKEYET
jgi:hypothetical protein